MTTGRFERGIHAEIAELARTLHNTDGPDAFTEDEVLLEVTTGAVRFLPGVDHAAVNLISGRGENRTVDTTAATGDVPATIGRFQHTMKLGPCITAIDTRQTVQVDDFLADTVWSALSAAIVENTPVRSGLSIPMFTDRTQLGSLTLYSEKPSTFIDDIVEQAVALATHAAIGLSSARRSDQFRSALASRDIIGQAKGIIMERYSVDATQAFRMLTTLSQDSNRPVTELAAQLVEIDHPEQA